MNIQYLSCALLFLGATVSLADDIELEGKFTQGGLIRGTVPKGSDVTFEGQRIRVSETGIFLIGFSRNAKALSELSVKLRDGRSIRKSISITERNYKVERIDGLPNNMVTPPKSVYQRIRSDNAAISEVRARNTPKTYFESGWISPARGRISGVYGSQRILNGVPRQPHYGIDIAAPIGTPVVSPADAVVALAKQNMYYTGGTIILDHGHGLTSALLHLNSIEVSVGMFINKGQRIGTIGQTGRASGPHLDWRINLFDARLDPAFLVPTSQVEK